MIDTAPLRRKLLDLAITGKLVPRQGEWRTVKLGDVGEWGAGATPSRSNIKYYQGGTIPWVKTGDLNDGIVTEVPECITAYALENTSVRLNPVGSVLIAMYGATIGKVGILGVEATTNQACCACQPNGSITNEYLYYFLLSQREQFKRLGGGGAQPNISKQIIVNYLIQLPSIAEQKAIVKRLEELLKVEGEIAAESAALNDLITAAKRKVLDLAIRGKLVPQDPADEPASELLKRIAAKRETQVSTDRRSRIKGSSVIFRGADRSAYETCDGKTVCIDDEIPFDIPDSWAWARLGSVSDYGKCVSVSTDQLSADTWSLDLEEIAKETGRLIERKTIGEKVSTSAKHVFKKGMVLYSKLRTYLNKVMVADMDGVCTSEIIPISLEGGILPEYLRNVLMSSYFLSYTAIRDYGVKMPRIGTEDARKALIPIPPFAEQKRIVAKVEKVRNLIELTTRT